MKLSLIIPVYNVEKYIETCLKSIINQLPENNVEVIIVNDGSPDKSIDIILSFLDNYADTFKSSFKIITQLNQGVSAARNRGIIEAKGEYLAFLDSDDYLKDNYFNELLSVINECQPDIIEFGAQRINDLGEISKFVDPIDIIGFSPMNSKIWLKISNRCVWCPWQRIYKARLFDNIFYPEGMNYAEDVYTTPDVYLKAKNIYFLDKDLIFYRSNPSSATAIKALSNIENLNKAVNKSINNLQNNSALSATVIALSLDYIHHSFLLEGGWVAYGRWTALKKIIKRNSFFNHHYILSRRLSLFYRFCFVFLIWWWLNLNVSKR